jgi:hypothetical protein
MTQIRSYVNQPRAEPNRQHRGNRTTSSLLHPLHPSLFHTVITAFGSLWGSCCWEVWPSATICLYRQKIKIPHKERVETSFFLLNRSGEIHLQNYNSPLTRHSPSSVYPPPQPRLQASPPFLFALKEEEKWNEMNEKWRQLGMEKASTWANICLNEEGIGTSFSFFQFLEHLLTPIISSGHLRAIDSNLALIFAHIIWTSPLLTVYHPKKISMTHDKWVTAYQKIDLRIGTASHIV